MKVEITLGWKKKIFSTNMETQEPVSLYALPQMMGMQWGYAWWSPPPHYGHVKCSVDLIICVCPHPHVTVLFIWNDQYLEDIQATI